MRRFLFMLVSIFFCLSVQAQEQLEAVAKQYLLAGDYEKAAPLYQQLLTYNEKDPAIIAAYIQCLIGIKDFNNAEKYLKKELKNGKSTTLQYELGRVYVAQGESKKSNKLFEDIIEKVSPLEDSIHYLANKFEKDGLLDLSIATYLQGKKLNPELPYLFAEELAVLNSKKGDEAKAIDNLLDLYISAPEKGEMVKATLLRLLNKEEKLSAFQQQINQKVKENPATIAYPDLLAWLYIQNHDYESAFKQIKDIDNRMDDQGRRVLGFARACLREKEFKTAVLAYQFVIDKGKDYPFYLTARSELLTTKKEELRKNPHYTQADVVALESLYDSFLSEYPLFKQKETMREYADLEVKYKQDVNKAIELLKSVTTAGNVDRTFKGRCKLEMGDYELIRNDVWEATLLYSQVDKEFKNDILGEEARFRNAKLSYYTGDFSWAQGQLDVLKASTSELIANDALNLSVLIVENNPPADSNSTPLLMFARADLLAFQNRNEEALTTLDSITTAFPSHVLADNILMVKADIAYKKQDYSEAAMHLQQIVTQYADDVLADDALYNLALINETFFSNKDEAKRLYEQLIVKYPGSTYINPARKAFRKLRGDKPDVDSL